MTKTEKADARREFERIISAAPYERSVARFYGAAGPWPGQYRDLSVQLAWELFQDGYRHRATREQASGPTTSQI